MIYRYVITDENSLAICTVVDFISLSQVYLVFSLIESREVRSKVVHTKLNPALHVVSHSACLQIVFVSYSWFCYFIFDQLCLSLFAFNEFYI